MTSMRIDKGASQELWAKRLAKLVDEMINDGCEFAAHGDVVYIYKGNDTPIRVELY